MFKINWYLTVLTLKLYAHTINKWIYVDHTGGDIYLKENIYLGIYFSMYIFKICFSPHSNVSVFCTPFKHLADTEKHYHLFLEINCCFCLTSVCWEQFPALWMSFAVGHVAQSGLLCGQLLLKSEVNGSGESKTKTMNFVMPECTTELRWTAEFVHVIFGINNIFIFCFI